MENSILHTGKMEQTKRSNYWTTRRKQLIRQMLVEDKKQLELLRNTSESFNFDRPHLMSQLERRIENLNNQLKNSSDIETMENDDRPEECQREKPNITLNQEENVAERTGSNATTVERVTNFPKMVSPIQQFETLSGVEEELIGEATPIDDDIFGNFLKLQTHLAHLAVFLHYLLSNSEPGFTLFYLITNVLNAAAYTKQWQQWAYEIYSSFIAENAPCLVTVDSDVRKGLEILFRQSSNNAAKESICQCFDRAREGVLVTIQEQLSDFRSKRVLGLGNVFGESLLIGLAENDTAKETKIFDTLLSQHISYCFDGNSEYRDLPRRSRVLLSCLATLFKQHNVKCSNATSEKLLEKCPTYISKEKSRFAYQLLPKSNRRVKNHCFVVIPVCNVIHCQQCRELLWGIKSTGFLCTKCNIVLHKRCMGKLRTECSSIGANDKVAQVKSTKCTSDGILALDHHLGVEAASSKLLTVQQPFDKQNQSAKAVRAHQSNCASGATNEPPATGESPEDNVACSLNRSKSMTIKKDYLAIASTESEAAQSSSSGQAGEKKATLKRVESLSDYLTADSPYLSDDSECNVYSVNLRQYETLSYDNDLDVDTETPPLEEALAPDIIEKLETNERKRLEVLYELIHTERTHVRNLKILYRIFYLRFLEYNIVPASLLKLMFPNLEVLLEIHTEMSDSMQALIAKDKLLGDIGTLCLSMFTGESGDRLKENSSTFCQRMQQALTMLKSQIKKDTKLREFLLVVEGLPICRKLQLRDMLPMEMQRLTKYPLLLEMVIKYSGEDAEQIGKIKRSLVASRAIVHAVNTAKRNCENHLRLEELQRQIDYSQFVKANHPIVEGYRQLDITTYGLVHEGWLDWRFGKNKTIPLHAVLLDDILLLLSRSSDGNRFYLRFHNANVNRDETKWTHCPLLKLTNLIAKDVARDRKAFFLVSTSPYGPQIYELAANCYTEKKSWLSYITAQIESCRKRSQISVAESPVKSEEDKPADDVSPDRSTVRNFEERVRVTCQPRLISPLEINVLQPTVFQHARPILNPLEQLKREDESVIRALNEKLRIISNFYGDKKDPVASASLAENSTCREARELVICAVKHTNRLLEAINEHTRLAEYQIGKGEDEWKAFSSASIPSVPCFQLTQIAAAQMECLTRLMNSLQIMGQDLRRVQAELLQMKLSPERLLACQLMCEKGVDTTEDGVLFDQPAKTSRSSYDQQPPSPENRGGEEEDGDASSKEKSPQTQAET